MKHRERVYIIPKNKFSNCDSWSLYPIFSLPSPPPPTQAEVLKKGKEDTLEVKEEEIKPDTTGGITTALESQVPVKDTNHELEVELLENRLHQRDDEIRILLRMLKQERKRANRAESSLNTAGMTVRSISPVSPDRLSPLRLARSVRDPSTGVSSTERTLPDGMSSQASSKVSERTHDASPRGSRLVDTGGDGSVRGTDMDGSRSHDESEKWRAALKAGWLGGGSEVATSILFTVAWCGPHA